MSYMERTCMISCGLEIAPWNTLRWQLFCQRICQHNALFVFCSRHHTCLSTTKRTVVENKIMRRNSLTVLHSDVAQINFSALTPAEHSLVRRLFKSMPLSVQYTSSVCPTNALREQTRTPHVTVRVWVPEPQEAEH